MAEMLDGIRRRLALNRAIREAIDTYPDGLCFATLDGRPVLVNRRLNVLCTLLTGHTLTNAELMWRELRVQRLSDATKEHLDGFSTVRPSSMSESLLCRLPDGRIWQFDRQKLIMHDMPIIQHTASDITDLFQYRQRLQESNVQAEKLHERQRELLRNIVQNNLAKEILAAKIRIHDDFGRLLLMSRNALVEDGAASGTDGLFAAWGDVIAAMGAATEPRTTSQTSPEAELVQVAGMIGCQVCFVGSQLPPERKPLLLLYAAVREALTNAVRHADADCLTVEIDDEQVSYHVTIRDNSHMGSVTIQEGSGLGNLRRRLEQEGAQMQIDGSDGVALILTIPKE